ncbi:MAG TPA: hypothetical protein VIU93_12315 [Gallionellaceae bacterium]
MNHFRLCFCFLFFAVVSTATAASPESEGLLLDWPDAEGWKVAANQENQTTQMIELIRQGETLDNWTQIGSMIWYKGIRVTDIHSIYEKLSDTFKKTCPDVKLEIQFSEATAEYPRIIFLQECLKTPKDGHPEAALFLAIQGKQSLYVAHRAAKLAHLPDNLRKKWVKWLKTGKVVLK